MERCNDKDLFIEPHPLEGIVLDIDTPCSQKAITSLPDNFQIRTKSDIKILQEYVAFNYTKGQCCPKRFIGTMNMRLL